MLWSGIFSILEGRKGDNIIWVLEQKEFPEVAILTANVLTHSDFETVSSQFSDFAFINPYFRIYILYI